MALSIRPRDLPRIRDAIVEFGGTLTAAEMLDLDILQGRVGNPTEAQRVVDSMVAATFLKGGELFYVEPEMCELARVAAQTLPAFTLAQDDPPSRAGMIWFSQPAAVWDAADTMVDICAVSWLPVRNTLRMSAHVERDAIPHFQAGNLQGLGFPAVFPLGSWDAPVGDDGLPKPIPGGDKHFDVLAVTKTLWLLMRQPLARESTEMPDRTARRRAVREGREPPPVRVIHLRRPSSSSGQSGEPAVWHHRWIVRGHWRMQPWGPGRQQRRPVWIAPFVKGPEGAPMLGGEKVYVLDQEGRT